jgi:hypothetical protein
LPKDKAIEIYEKVLATVDPEKAGEFSRPQLLQAFQDQANSIDTIMTQNKSTPAQTHLVSSLMTKLESVTSGEITKPQLLDALAAVAPKPLDKRQIVEIADRIMGN